MGFWEKYKGYEGEQKATAEFWDAHAHPFASYSRRSPYCDAFLSRARIKPGETVFDMGCGSGTLCIPLSDGGHEVFCADFSEGMLDSVRQVIEDEGIERLTLCHLDWDEDWEARDLPVCDVAIASRSLFMRDIPTMLAKLDGQARRRVCITLNAGRSMFGLSAVAVAIGRGEPDDPAADWHAAIKAVVDMGYNPQVDYITTQRFDVFETCEDCIAFQLRKVAPLAKREEEAFWHYCEDRIVEYDDGETVGWYCLDDTVSSWGFLAWDKEVDLEGVRTEVLYHEHEEEEPEGLRALWRRFVDWLNKE